MKTLETKAGEKQPPRKKRRQGQEKADIDGLVSACLEKYVIEPTDPVPLEGILEMIYSYVKPTDYQRIVPIITQCYACARMKKENIFLKTLPSFYSREKTQREQNNYTVRLVRDFYEDVFNSNQVHAYSYSRLGDMKAPDYCLLYMFLAATTKRRLEDKAFPILLIAGETSTGELLGYK